MVTPPKKKPSRPQEIRSQEQAFFDTVGGETRAPCKNPLPAAPSWSRTGRSNPSISVPGYGPQASLATASVGPGLLSSCGHAASVRRYRSRSP